MAHPARNRFWVEQIGIVITVNHESLIGLDDVEKQIEIHRGLWIWVYFNLQTGEGEILADLFEIELHLDKRQAAGIAAQLQIAHESAVSIGLVILRVEKCALHLLEQLGGRLPLNEPGANRKEIHAVADEVSAFEQRLARRGDADDYVILCGQSVQE